MKIILSFLIIAQIYRCDCSVYDWNVKTVERESDFDDDLKIQTALSKELQKDRLKIAGKPDKSDDRNFDKLRKPYDFKKTLADEYRKPQDLYEYKYKYDRINNARNEEMLNQKEFNREENVDQQNYLKHKQPQKNEESVDYGNDYNDYDKYHKPYHIYHSSNRDHSSNHIDYNNPNANDNHQNFLNPDNRNNANDNHQTCLNPDNRNNANDNHQTCLNPDNRKQNDNEDNNSNLNHIHIGRDPQNDNSAQKHEDSDDRNNQNNKNNNKDTYNEKKQNENENAKNINNDKNHDYSLISTHCPAKAPDIENFVGTNLFDSIPKKCFSTEDVAVLNARRDFESLIPKDLPQCLLNDRMSAVLLNYFYVCHEMITKMSADVSKDLAQKAYYDTIGGYLHYYLVPVAKYSYYGGHISLDTVKSVLKLHQHCKKYLNTNGNGWKSPLKNVLNELKTVRIEPLHLDEGKKCDEPSFCMHLDLSTNQNDPDDDKLIVPIPSLEADDSNGYLGNILLPFRRKRTFDLRSEVTAYVVVKFYETLTKCYQFQNISQDSYNKKFRFWLLENIHVHLSDEQFYPGLGAVLRIYEFLKRGKKEIAIYGDEFGNAEFDNELEREYNFVNEHKRNYIKSKELVNILNKSKMLKRKSNAEIDATEESDYVKHSKSDEGLERDTKETLSKEQPKDSGPTKVEATKLGATAVQPAPTPNPTLKIRTLDLTTTQLYVISIPAVAFIIIILICCYKCCCKKKKPPALTKKDSSSSSSNLISSPVRFFYVKPKPGSGKSTTSMDYSTSEMKGKRGKKSVKIDKKATTNTDTSASSSPKKNKSGSAKSNSKSSWETTYSSK